MNYYVQNCIYLAERFPALVERLRAVPAGTPDFTIVSAKSKALTVKLPAPGGKEKFLHSVYDPVHEAQTLCAEVYRPDVTLFVCLGFGLGYQCRELIKKIRREQTLLIIEPSPAMFQAALAHMDLQEVFQSAQVLIIVADHAPQRTHQIRACLHAIVPYKAHTMQVEFIPLYARWEEFRPFVQQTKQKVRAAVTRIQKMRAQSVEAIDTLRTGGLAKKFLGNYGQCLNYFRNQIKQGELLEQKEIGLLATYFLVSHYSYAETFEQGERTL